MEENIQKELNALVDADYKEKFLDTYPEGARRVIGVPNNPLHELAREYAHRRNWREVVDTQLAGGSFEEELLQALIVGTAEQDADAALEWFAGFLPCIDSRQLCDAVCLAFHTAIEYPEKTLDFIRPLLYQTDCEFSQRFAIVTLLDYFVTIDYIDSTLSLYAATRPFSRLSQEALAWGYEVCFLTFQQKTVYALRESTLSYNYYNSIIDRISHSPRINEVQRGLVEELRR